mmetsp:Transcript_368/g.625  ORF Transcript_368/g.625 Transcript_368/m.625 type:complete len:102 (-) Transcript_368:4333-4638(-)
MVGLSATRLVVTLRRSKIGCNPVQRQTIACLGLNKIRQARVHPDSPVVWGWVSRVTHLVSVERVDASAVELPISRRAKRKESQEAKVETKNAQAIKSEPAM